MTVTSKKLFSWIMAIAMVVVFSFGSMGPVTVNADTGLTTVTPVLVVTGTGLIEDGTYTADNVSNEKSYSLAELKALEGVTGQLYSGKKSQEPYTKSYSIVDGVKISSLLSNLSTYTGLISIVASDGYAATFDTSTAYSNDGKIKNKPGLASGRYYYDGFDASQGTEVPAVIAWASADTINETGGVPASKPTATKDKSYLRLYVGQYASPEDMNAPLYNGGSKGSVNKVLEGDELTEVVLKVGSKEYTRAQVLLMDYAEREYTYLTSDGNVTETVRGVPMSVLLAGEDDDAVVSFAAADGYAVEASGKTVKELVDANYMLAYYNVTKGKAIYSTAKKDATKHGFFALYGDGDKPAKMVNNVNAVKGIDYANSPYKHINNGGITGQSGPYNVDAITGATLTIEGPGTKTSVPLAVKDLEAQNAGCYRGVYTDVRGGDEIERTYEGVDLYYILTQMTTGTNGIQLTDKAAKVAIKNQNRETTSTFTIDEVKAASEAGNPILISYGTAWADGTDAKPYVFDYSTGGDEDLGNYDGCLKLVYDYNTYGKDNNYKTFSNMAYIYVEEAETKGYKHTEEPYKSAENSQYFITLTGDALGYEVNYTVDELENLVEYDESGNIKSDNKYGYRAEYSLANSTYWYVNEYEGVKLWSLLLRSGIDSSKATDTDTQVSFRSTDNYGGFDKFTLAQVADPSLFGFYKKNTSDPGDGSYEGDERIRSWDEQSQSWVGDKVADGYPVLVAYGVNEYPYVKSNKLDGYLSGLQNDGGPLRVIWGKTNYAHANGSNQAKLVEKVIVGKDTYHYSTHKYNSNTNYTSLADNTLAVKITTETDAGTKTLASKDVKVGEIEDIVYDGKLASSELLDAKVKNFYQGKQGYSDLYEGVDLAYFLKNYIGLAGTQGTVTFTYLEDGSEKTVEKSLEDLLNLKGYNKDKGLSGLTAMIAYGKNGTALVSDKTSAGYVDKRNFTNEGYESSYTVKNQGGPLMVLIPAADNSTNGEYICNVTGITVSLETDKYAHVDSPYDTYADNTLTVSGDGTKLTEAKSFKVSDLEGKQSLLVTADYSFKNSKGTVSQLRYRGLNLYNFLKSTDVGIKSNAEKIKVTTTDDSTVEISIADLQNTYTNTVTSTTGLPVMLAFGSAAVTNENIKDGKALVATDSSEGYDANYSNAGGPLMLIIGQTDENDVNKSKCVKSVKSIEVIAGATTRWTHDQGVFKQYLTDTFKVVVKDSDKKELYSKTYTVAELEAMESLVERTEITATQTNEYEGLALYKFLDQECKAAGVSFDNVGTVNVIKNRESEFYPVDILGKIGRDQLVNGMKDGTNRISLLLAYAVDGYPLAFGDKKDPKGEGYDSTIGNDCGPIRLMVHNTQGACISEVNEIEMILSAGTTPAEDADYTVSINGTDNALTIANLKKLTATEKTYKTKDGNEKVRGVLVSDLLASLGVTNTESTFDISAGGYDGSGTYVGITLAAAIAEEYLVAYEVYDENGKTWVAIDDTAKTPNSKVRVYRNYLENHQDADQTKWFNKCQYTTGLAVTVPAEPTAYTVTIDGVATELKMADLKNLTATEKTYTTKDGSEKVRGVLMSDLLASLGVTDTETVFNIAAGGYNGKGTYVGITLAAAIAEEYLVAYEVYDDKEKTWVEINDTEKDPDSVVRVYRNYLENHQEADQSQWFNKCQYTTGIDVTLPEVPTVFTIYNGDGTVLPMAGIRSTAVDINYGLWIGTYGGGLSNKLLLAQNFTTYNSASTPALESTFVSAVATDAKGGVWMSQNASYTDPTANKGVVYMKDGQITQYRAGEGTIPNDYVQAIKVDKDGNVWFGSFGGLTKYDPKKKTWQTWTTADGLPAMSVSTIELDTVNGGLWLGFYPDSEDPTGGTKEFVGGFAYFKNGAVVKSYQYTSAKDATTGNYRLGDVWVRDIAVDNKGGAWIVASGSYTGMDNCGGKVWYVAQPGGDAVAYTGYDLVGKDNLASATNSELRAVAIDPDGGLWFGSSADGVFYIKDPTVSGGKLTVTKQYSKAKKSWSAKNFDNVFSIDFYGKTAYIGTAAGLATYTFDFTNSAAGANATTAGDSNAAEAALSIVGAGVSSDWYFSVKGLKNSGVTKLSKSYHYKNSKGNEADSAVEGAYLEDLLNIVGAKENVTKIVAVSSDGRTSEYTIDQIKATDIQGNKAILCWKVDGENSNPTIVVGQYTEGEVNKSKWAKEVVKLVVYVGALEEISDATVAAIDDVVFEGSAVTPEVTLTFNEKTLVKGVDYTVEYLNNAAVGTATVKITGMGSFTGTTTATFNVISANEKKLKEEVTELTESNKQLQESVATLTESNTALQQSVATLTQSNTALQQSVTELTTANIALQQNVANLAQANELLKQNVQSMGESIATMIATAATAQEELQQNIAALNAKLMLMSNPLKLSSKVSGTKVTVSWNAIPGCTYLVNGEGVDTNSYTATVAAGSSKTFTVKAIYSVGSVNEESEAVSTTVKVAPAKASLSSAANVKGGKIKATWKAATGAAKYEVSISTSKTGTSVVGTTTSKTFTSKKLKTKKTYYVKVRAIGKNGVASAWSTVKTVKVTK